MIYNTIENPLFLAKDVAEWIEHSQVSRMIQSVDEDEKVVNIVHTLGGNQKSWFLTEDGLYEVFMQSLKPIAKQFKKKIKEILKEIRKTGHYGGFSYDNKIEIATLISKCKNAKGVEALMTLFEIKVPVIVNDNEIVGSRSKSVGLIGQTILKKMNYLIFRQKEFTVITHRFVKTTFSNRYH